MAVQQTIGTVLKVVLGTPTTYDAAGFATLEASATEVGEVITVSQYGGSATVVTRTPIKTGVIDKGIGSEDAGQLSITLTKDLSDAGQTVLTAGAPSGANRGAQHSVFITEPGGGKAYATGKISSFTTDGYSADLFIGASCNIELDNSVIYA